MFTVLSQWMRAPCGSAQLWAEKLKQPKTYAHLGSGEEERERAEGVEEEGKKCRAQDPVGSRFDHLANTLITRSHTHTQIYTHLQTLCRILQRLDLIQIIPFPFLSLSSALWLLHYHICSLSNAPALVSFVRELIRSSLLSSPLLHGPVLPFSETLKDRDRELIQQHVWCIFKQLWTFSSFQPTEDLICYNLISGWNHTAYLSNIKYLPFSLSGHLTENRKKKKDFILFPANFPPFTVFHLALKRSSDLSSNYHLFFCKERMFKCC